MPYQVDGGLAYPGSTDLLLSAGGYTAVSQVGILVLTVLTLAGALRFPAASLAFPLILIVLPTLFASFYASYRDVFGYDAAP